MTEVIRSRDMTLADYPCEFLRLECDRCGKTLAYRRGPLMALFGESTRIAEVLEGLAACTATEDSCGAKFADNARD
jgi:hypothetical protein